MKDQPCTKFYSNGFVASHLNHRHLQATHIQQLRKPLTTNDLLECLQFEDMIFVGTPMGSMAARVVSPSSSTLATHNNYKQWCSAPLKRPLCKEIILEMNRNGIHHWSYHNISLKMTLLRGSHHQAYKWRSTTNGLASALGVDGSVVIVHRHLRCICRYWDELGPIMRADDGEDF
ncbi:hypothetical protein PGT21_028815 [Puccinia graminis f. sp. tritici]|uniref:Uncharacterized protein n=1 Tax=Puccinia graminis f. sp. tritici TaxID=56615 RepID=A0A5B0QNW0_PUCGR|nr:hypothetical protein PGT21_028815 [Puccinia graminis f. sp. tritici]